MRVRAFQFVAGAGLAVATSIAPAQTPSSDDTASLALEEIVVTARRKDESIQDVPTTINAVTGEDLAKFDLRKFEDIASVVPGLSMTANPQGTGGTASVRGVAFDVLASGNNGTVEFYLNDAPISAGNLFQATYDIQQFELLRGPQGTLRGRASPSGSITVTTRRPDLSEMGGYVSATATDIGGYNGQGAFNFPIVADKLAFRVAGVYDENESNRVTSLHNSTDPAAKTKSGRATVRFEPTDSLSFTLTGQVTELDVVNFDAVESQQVINPSAAVNPGATGGPAIPFIGAGSRRSVEDTARTIAQDFNNYNFQAQWAFAGQKLNYVGARNEQHLESFQPADIGDFFPSNYPAFLQGFGQAVDTHSYATAHELRLSSEERIAGIFDYVVGAFTQKARFPTDLTRPTAVLFGLPSPTIAGLINLTPIARRGANKETSGFANLTTQLGASTELSAGARYIEYEAQGSLAVSGARIAAAEEHAEFHKTIYSVSLKHSFSDDLMLYASTGTSWRPGITVTGDFSLARSALENSFLILPPEESKSYEIGLKTSALDKRLRANLALYHQKFDHYPHRASSGVFYVDTPAPGFTRVNQFNFVAAVPVDVNGVEAELAFAPLAEWDVGLVAAYSKGEIKNGLIPCNDYAPRDGVSDGPAAPPSVTTIRTATGGDNLSSCTANQRASLAPLVSASLQSEYRISIASALTGYVRGLLSFYGSSKNDPTNAVDDYDSYALLNVFFGIRDPDGAWDVSLYGKNVTDTERVLTRASNVANTAYNIGTAGQNSPTNYYGGDTSPSGLSFTPPREFGLTVRYAFGSR